MKVDSRAFQKAIDKLIRRALDVKPLADRVARESVAVARAGSQLNIYSTAEGAYSRTRALLNGWRAQATVQGVGATVTISNSTPYAQAVEFGRGGSSAAVVQAAIAGGGKPVSLGRSGKDYKKPAPMATVAAVYAGKRLTELWVKQFTARL